MRTQKRGGGKSVPQMLKNVATCSLKINYKSYKKTSFKQTAVSNNIKTKYNVNIFRPLKEVNVQTNSNKSFLTNVKLQVDNNNSGKILPQCVSIILQTSSKIVSVHICECTYLPSIRY